MVTLQRVLQTRMRGASSSLSHCQQNEPITRQGVESGGDDDGVPSLVT